MGEGERMSGGTGAAQQGHDLVAARGGWMCSGWAPPSGLRADLEPSGTLPLAGNLAHP